MVSVCDLVTYIRYLYYVKDIYITLRADKKSERRNAINRTDDARCK